MTELNSIKAGDKVLVKIGRNMITCEVMAVSPVGVTVRSLSTGREFTTARVEEIAGRTEPNPPATEASEPLKTSLTEMPVEEPAEEEPADEKPEPLKTSLTEMPVEEPAEEEPADEKPEPLETSPTEMPVKAFQFTRSEVSRILEMPLTEMPVEEPADEKNTDEENAAEGAAAADESKPRKKLSLLNAAIEVLKAEGRPLNTRELVKLAKDRGLWTPTGCKTPEQSLYGAIFLEIKNSDTPRIRKSQERGKFELA